MKVNNTIITYPSDKIVCGCDEAGRGSLAGPVVAAAVIFPKGFVNSKINDSKKLSYSKRLELSTIIKKGCLAWSIGQVDSKEIDKINILNASIKAMHKAIRKLIIKDNTYPQIILVDGNKFTPFNNIEYKCIVKGDAKYMSIAAASILAKSHRDEIMIKLHKKHNFYNWNQNKGYPTKDHKMKITKMGISKYHRKSFNLPKQVL
tara:strand:+ start:1030 stop:1641 length:612 start_codon:yes stop_codon:yes gene_type:complete